MKKNMGLADKVFRLLAATTLGILYFTGIVSGALGIILVVIATIFLLTSLVNFCPLYVPFGIKTCKTKGVTK